jgi:hypothetical protein
MATIPVDHVDYCQRCGVEMLDIDIGFCLSLQEMVHGCEDGGIGDVAWRRAARR